MIIAIVASIIFSGCGVLNLDSVSSPIVKVKCKDNAKFTTHYIDSVPQKQLADKNTFQKLPAKDKGIDFHPISTTKNLLFNNAMSSEISVIKTPKELCAYTWHQILYGSLPVLKNNLIKSQPKPNDKQAKQSKQAKRAKQAKQAKQDDGLIIFGVLLLILGMVFLILGLQLLSGGLFPNLKRSLIIISILLIVIGIIVLVVSSDY
jgi:hypothetical protein